MRIPFLAIHSWAQISSFLTLILIPIPFGIWKCVVLRFVYRVINFLDYFVLIKEKKRPFGAQEVSSSSSFLRYIYYILNNKNTFWTDFVLWFSNANKIVNGNNLFPGFSCTPLLDRTFSDTLSLRLLSPAFLQVSPRKSTYSKGIIKAFARATEMRLTSSIFQPQLLHSSKFAISFEL